MHQVQDRDSLPDSLQQTQTSSPHKGPTASSCSKNGRKQGQVFDVFSVGMSEWKCADRTACRYVLEAQDKSLNLTCQINTDHIPHYLLLTQVDPLSLGIIERKPPCPHRKKQKKYSFIPPPHTRCVCVQTAICFLIDGWVDGQIGSQLARQITSARFLRSSQMFGNTAANKHTQT